MGVLARISLQSASGPTGDVCVLLEEWGEWCYVKLVIESVIGGGCRRGLGTALWWCGTTMAGPTDR